MRRFRFTVAGMESAAVSEEPERRARVLVARLIRPHGRRGELVAEILTDFPELFHQRRVLWLIPPQRVGTRGREMELENFWFLRSRIVLKFRGIDSINDAEGLRGYDVAIAASERAPLDAHSVYVSDLVGCRVVDLNMHAADVGEVVDVDRGSSNTDLLVVRRPRGRPGGQTGGRSDGKASEPVLIPFVREYLVEVDTAKRQILMRLPEGLLEINAPMTDEEKVQQRTSGEKPAKSERTAGE